MVSVSGRLRLNIRFADYFKPHRGGGISFKETYRLARGGFNCRYAFAVRRGRSACTR